MNSFLSKFIRVIPSRYFSTCKKGIPPPSTEGSYKKYRTIFLFIAVPIIGILSQRLLSKKLSEEPCRPPFIKYEYLRLRSKRFPWGDGQKSFFHNPIVNPLPDGYEDANGEKEENGEKGECEECEEDKK